MTDQTEQPQESLFAYPRLGPNFSIKDIANAIATIGVPYPTAHGRVKIYAKFRFIHVREKGVTTQPNGYDFSDAAAACVLSALQEAGVQDHEVLQAASQALYAWTDSDGRDSVYRLPGQAHLPRHPIDRAVFGIWRFEENWSLHVDVWRDPQTGNRTINCDLVQFGRPNIGQAKPEDSAFPAVSLVVPLDWVVRPVIQKLHTAQVVH
ncbi:MAG: hypothetical protein Q8M59_13215 [Tabrizicola sp.]|uniref:hypothetical protein n=1 Tax=Tabrizicola sp. TaxID=2005166 RepID=UPI002734777A|nr:hypothetical protein [Tabrizicola sp.]MDP3263914.1 hypothetical protein [Tabrizicola sp.]MDP3647279.1 hypothetical protein [Paracoccaceae bacterium]